LYVFDLLFAPLKSINHHQHREKTTQIARGMTRFPVMQFFLLTVSRCI